MGRKDERPGDAGRDYATLLGMGWTPDTLVEAISIAGDLLRDGESDAALAAVESARASLLTARSSAGDRAALEAVAFEVALRRGDSTRAIAAANALRAGEPGLPRAEVERLNAELSRSSVFRVELKEALERVLDAVIAAVPAGPEPPGVGATAELFAFGAGEDDLPYLDADPDVLGSAAAAREREEASPAGIRADGGPEVDWLLLAEDGPVQVGWSPGHFVVNEGEDLQSVRARFLEAATGSGTEHAREACETGWSFFLMEDFEAAALLFDQALGEPAVRVSAAEGLVRCRLNLAQPGDAVALLERLQSLCYAERLPEALRYWYGRAAEAAGEVRKARTAYRSLPAEAFPDVRGRLGALP